MPHPDNSNWLSLLAGQPVKAVQPTSVEEIPALRQAFRGGHNENLPEMAEVHEEVVLRDRQGMKLTAEIYVPKGDGPFPTLLYMHGGGWCVGSAEETRWPAMRI